MNMWVTGANGFIGRHLVRVLADRGNRVHGIGHGAIGDAEKHRIGLEHWLNGEIDAANLNALAERVRDCRRRFSIWPAALRSGCRSRSRLRTFRAPLRVRPDCWSGCAVPPGIAA